MYLWAEMLLRLEENSTCCVRACSRGDTYIRRRFQPMTLLVTGECQFHCLDQQLALALALCPPSLGCQMETKVDSDNMTSFPTHVLSWMRFQQQSQNSTALEAPVQTRERRCTQLPLLCASLHSSQEVTQRLHPRKTRLSFLHPVLTTCRHDKDTREGGEGRPTCVSWAAMTMSMVSTRDAHDIDYCLSCSVQARLQMQRLQAGVWPRQTRPELPGSHQIYYCK